MTPIVKANYFILTGAPGTGKTSVLEQIALKGFAIANEPARQVLEHQLKIDGPALPAKDPQLFIETMLAQSIQQYESFRLNTGPVFFDRGIPDLVVYAMRFGVDPSKFEGIAHKYLYNRTAFICPPWKDIFVNDAARKLSFEMSLQVHQLHLEVYKRLNFDLVEVPFDTAQKRADFLVGFSP